MSRFLRVFNLVYERLFGLNPSHESYPFRYHFLADVDTYTSQVCSHCGLSQEVRCDSVSYQCFGCGGISSNTHFYESESNNEE